MSAGSYRNAEQPSFVTESLSEQDTSRLTLKRYLTDSYSHRKKATIIANQLTLPFKHQAYVLCVVKVALYSRSGTRPVQKDRDDPDVT